MSNLIRNLKFSAITKRQILPFIVSRGFKGVSTLNQLNSSISTDTINKIKCLYKSTSILCTNYSSVSHAHCWNCGKANEHKISQLFCDHCNSLQRPNPEANLFDVVGIKQAFDIDENELIKNYKNLQRQLHPDKYGTRSAKERSISEDYSSLVNKAYSTLLKPLNRGIYLLNLHGIEIPEKTEVESVFLIEIMEKNEEVENAKTKDEILELNLDNKRTMESLCKEISVAFETACYNDVMTILIRLKYYDSIDTEIKKIIRKMGFIQ